MGFYGSNDPTDSVKALKEVVVLKISLNPTTSTSLCYKPTHACNTYTKMNPVSEQVKEQLRGQLANAGSGAKWLLKW